MDMLIGYIVCSLLLLCWGAEVVFNILFDDYSLTPFWKKYTTSHEDTQDLRD